MQLPAAAVVALSLLLAGPDGYTERSLCDLWAGAQCHATSCLKDAKERCAMASRRCRGTTRSPVSKDKADRTAACAKALLQGKCGGPTPPECSNVDSP